MLPILKTESRILSKYNVRMIYLKKYTIKLYIDDILKYVISFIVIIVIFYFLDGKKFTKDSVSSAISITIGIICGDIITYFIKKRKAKKIKKESVQ